MKKTINFSIAFIAAAFGLLTLATASHAATYYVATNGSDGASGSSSSPWATINKGVRTMAAGDTLIIRNGVYSGDSNRIYNPPSGSSGAYTTIKAETDWGVIITGQSSGNHACRIGAGYHHIQVRGIRFFETIAPKVYLEGSYCKIIRCASDGAGGSSSSFLVTGSYNLFEDCYAWGAGRYPFDADDYAGTGNTHHNVFRRCVVRWDFGNTTEPSAAFASYNSKYSAYQNCIAIDGQDVKSNTGVYRGIAGFKTPNGSQGNQYIGCIILNFQGPAFFFERNPVSEHLIRNCVAWDLKEEDPSATYKPVMFLRSEQPNPPDSLDIEHCTIGKVEAVSQWGGELSDVSNDSITDSILTRFTLGSGTYVIKNMSEDYNVFYGNTGNMNAKYPGSHSRTNYDPLGSALKYLTRIESGSTLKGAASDGADIGATVLYRVGADGTLWGESGWDTVTTTPLWPFPNEDIMREDMRSFSAPANAAFSGSPAMTGARGFCADGTTLTKYIWEYLGYPIPSNIYGASSDTTPPGTIGNLAAATGTGTGQIELSWTATGDDGSSGTASSYAIRYSTSAITSDSQFNSASAVAGAPSPAAAGSTQSVTVSNLTGGTTYYFAIKALDEAGNAGGLSNSPNAAAKSAAPPNTPPVLASIGAKSAVINIPLTFVISATDADGNPVTYSATGLPSGASLNATSGSFAWTPSSSQAGSVSVTFSANDGKGGSDSETVAFTVTATDTQKPYLDGLNPASNEIQVPVDTNIRLHIKDSGSGIDPTTIGMTVIREGDASPITLISSGSIQLPSMVTMQGTTSDYLIVYDPPSTTAYRFFNEQDITVTVNVADKSGNKLTNSSYTFTTAMIVRGPNKKVSKR